MKRRIVIKDAAVADLDAMYWQGVELWGRRQARVYLEALESLFDLLAEQPEIARQSNEFDPPVRIYPFRSHVIIYKADTIILDILRVVHGKTDWMEVFSG